ncbi:MAG: hypothetical protein ACLQDY_00305 [Streptosporangiaceae bacterium]
MSTAPLDLERIGALARALAASDSGPAAELGCALAAAVTELSQRVDALWQVIDAALQAAGLGADGLGAAMPGGTREPPGGEQAGGPPAELVRALAAPRGPGQGVRLTIDGQDWVAAVSPGEQPADPAAAWAALQQIAATAADQDRM